MLQQTQVSTVIAYWNKWIERWPSIADLAKADIEEVNAAWRETLCLNETGTEGLTSRGIGVLPESEEPLSWSKDRHG